MDSHLNKHPLRRGLVAALATAALLVPVLSSGSAQAEPGDDQGNATVRVFDALGRPAGGGAMLVPVDVDSGSGGSMQSPTGVFAFTDKPVGQYGIVTMTPWGGVSCAGMTTCELLTFSGSPGVATGAITVVDEEAPVTYTLRTPAPATIGGSGTVGNELKLTWSPQMKSLMGGFGGIGGPYAPTVQWLRNGAPITNATDDSYVTQGADVGRTVSVRLEYPVPLLWNFMGAGATPTPYAVAGRKVSKGKSRTTVDVLRKKIVQGRSPGILVDVTAGDLPAAGKVKIKIGKHTFKKTLRNGSARVPVPATLKPGGYKVVATYLGSSSYAPSKATGRFTVVRKG